MTFLYGSDQVNVTDTLYLLSQDPDMEVAMVHLNCIDYMYCLAAMKLEVRLLFLQDVN